jgi:hypothetical protein
VAEYWKVAGAREEAVRTLDEPADGEKPLSSTTPTPDPDAEAWEYTFFDGKKPEDPRVRRTFGLGAIINRATEEERYAVLAAAALLMAGTVVLINRFLWHRLAMVAERKFSLSR